MRKQLHMMRLWLTPGMRVKRHVSVAVFGTVTVMFGVIGLMLWALEGQRQIVSMPIEGVLVSDPWDRWGGWVSGLTIIVGLVLLSAAIARLNRSLLSNWMPRPREAAEVLHKRLSLAKGSSIVAIGGGTGLSNLLRGLRDHTSNITAVVTVSDDGGSSGRLRDAFNMPAPGDLSDCLAALSDNESEVSRLLQYRFERGEELKGHTFGNLLITTLTEVEGDFGQAIRAVNVLLNLTGAVYPVTPEPVGLRALKTSGEWVSGESKLADLPGSINKVIIDPPHPTPTPEVLSAILEADLIVMGPGSLFTSVIPPLLVPSTKRAILASDATLIYICNIMSEVGETDGFSAFDHVKALFEHLGRYPDIVVVNGTPVETERLKRYRAAGAEVVAFNPELFKQAGMEAVALPLLGDGPHAQHDSATLARWLASQAKRKDRIAA